ncbi:MAG TPA: hypothetical protein VG983_01300, partial [Caulobacterales bacterium]|nr:hypothetical protein [Caulobacterales bacterium]
TEEERAALLEVTRFGFPPRAWFNFERIAFGYTGVFTTLVDRIVDADPAYFEDFWTKPGYLGFDPPESLKRARIQRPAKIAALIMPDEARQMRLPLTMPAAQTQSGVNFPAALRIEPLPAGNLQGASILVKSGAAKGHTLYIAGVRDDAVMIGFGAGHFEAMAGLRAGDDIVIDNSVYLATQTYHRHQIPSPEYYVWSQYKGPDGKPLYPQRPLLPGQDVQSGGATQSGRFHGKIIVLQALWDEAAYPWSADWYRARVKAALGDAIDDRYRLYFIDNAMHTTQAASARDPRPVASTRVISYQGALQQALRDLAAWVEKGAAPPPSTEYEVMDGQVIVPSGAKARKGIQPIVSLRANGAERAEVKIGEPVAFTAAIEAPPDAGAIVKAEWDFDGAGAYPHASNFTPGARVTVNARHAFAEPGIYFPALRVSANRASAADDPYAQVLNIARVRVVVA